jgi:hypothetical protein
MATNTIMRRAFNAGYLIEKYLPKLSKLLVSGFQDRNSPFAQGFVAGTKEMGMERTQNKAKFLDKLKKEFGNKTPSKSKKRDDREKDIDI